MSTLFTFGCSYTEDFEDNNILNYKNYKKFRGGNFPESWPTILAKKLNFKVKNFGEGASGNNQIFNKFCTQIKNIKKGDIVIIEWSYMTRYRWVSMISNRWMSLGVGMVNSVDLSEDTHQEICINRTHQLYIDEIYDYMKVIDYLSELVGFGLYYWSGDCNVIYPIPISKRLDKKFLMTNLIGEDNETPFNEVFRLGGKRIFEETDDIVNDNHFGESAHKIMADLFYDHIINYKEEMVVNLHHKPKNKII
jgi:hypothetical protein